MCMAIPSQVVDVNGEMATVECFGVRRTVSLMLMGEKVEQGDYVLIQAGGFAYEKVSEEDAKLALDTIRDVLEEGSSRNP